MTNVVVKRRKWRSCAVFLLAGMMAISMREPLSHAEDGMYLFESAKANYTSFENTFSDGTTETFDQPTFRDPGIPGTPYCIEPKVWFIRGEKQQMDFVSYMKEKRNLTFTQEQITHLALGLDYIENRMTNTGNLNRNILAQAYLWLKLPAPDGATIVKMKVGGNEEIATRIEAEADTYAEANANRAIGKGYAYYAAGGQTMGSFTVTYYGGVRLKKAPANPTLAGFSDLYSLKGAVYGVTDANGKEVGRFTTDDSGVTNVLDVAPGIYKVQEVESPNGYMLDSKIYTVEVKENETAEVFVVEVPVMISVDLLVKKNDAQTGEPVAGAEYTLKYFAAEEAEGVPYSIWAFRTDENGEIHLGEQDFVHGDDLFYNEQGEVVLPLGCYTVQETKAPDGYQLDETVYEQTLLPGVEKGSEVLWNPVTSSEEPTPEESEIPKKKETSVVSTVNTGDSGKPEFFGIAGLLAIAGLIGLFVNRKKGFPKGMK